MRFKFLKFKLKSFMESELPKPELQANPLDQILNGLNAQNNLQEQLNRANLMDEVVNGDRPLEDVLENEETPVNMFLRNVEQGLRHVGNQPGAENALAPLLGALRGILQSPDISTMINGLIAMLSRPNPPNTPIPDRPRIINRERLSHVRRRLDFDDEEEPDQKDIAIHHLNHKVHKYRSKARSENVLWLEMFIQIFWALGIIAFVLLCGLAVMGPQPFNAILIIVVISMCFFLHNLVRRKIQSIEDLNSLRV